MQSSTSSRLLATCEQAYQLLLFLYPAAHRRDYGTPMAQAFRDLAQDAYRRGAAWGLCRLWVRILGDTAVWAAAERLAALAGSGEPVVPASWPAVAMSIVPGVGVLATMVGSRLRLPAHLGPVPLGTTVSYEELGLLVTLLLTGALSWRQRRLPVCGLAVLGVFLGLSAAGPLTVLWVPIALVVAAGSLLKHRRGAVHWPAPAWAILALLAGLSLWPRAAFDLGWGLLGVLGTLAAVALGLPLARRHGLAAGLFVVASGFALWDGTFGLTYGLGGTFWADAMWVILAAFLLVLSPLWVLRARSQRAQVRGLLVPTLAALAAVVAINALVRVPLAYGISNGSPGPGQLLPLLLRDGVTAVQILLVLLLAVVLYPWAERQGRLAVP